MEYLPTLAGSEGPSRTESWSLRFTQSAAAPCRDKWPGYTIRACKERYPAGAITSDCAAARAAADRDALKRLWRPAAKSLPAAYGAIAPKKRSPRDVEQ